MSNNCPCILCHVGRSCGFRDSDFAPLVRVVEALQNYDLSQSPYPLDGDTRQDMIRYTRKHSIDGMVNFETLEYFFEEGSEAEKP